MGLTRRKTTSRKSVRRLERSTDEEQTERGGRRRPTGRRFDEDKWTRRHQSRPETRSPKSEDEKTTLFRRFTKKENPHVQWKAYQRPDCRKHEDEITNKPDQIAERRGRKYDPLSSIWRERNAYKWPDCRKYDQTRAETRSPKDEDEKTTLFRRVTKKGEPTR